MLSFEKPSILPFASLMYSSGSGVDVTSIAAAEGGAASAMVAVGVATPTAVVAGDGVVVAANGATAAVDGLAVATAAGDSMAEAASGAMVAVDGVAAMA